MNDKKERAKKAVESLKGERVPFPWWNPQKELTGDVRLYISVPTYDNKVNLLQDGGLRQGLANSLLGDKLKFNFFFNGSDSLICRSRDKMALYFLESGYEWHLQIDDDIIFPFGLGPQLANFYQNWMGPEIFNMFMGDDLFKLALSMNAIDEILRSGIKDNKKIVGGLYFWRGGQKNFNEAASILPSTDSGDAFEIEFTLKPDNYIYTDRLATGFLLTHRSVYEDIMKAFPELEYSVPNIIPGRGTFAFFTPLITDEEVVMEGKTWPTKFYRSEDYAFAWRAKQVGYEPCLNMNLLLGHLGNHIYSWFDRPQLQKIVWETFVNPMHSMQRGSAKDETRMES